MSVETTAPKRTPSLTTASARPRRIALASFTAVALLLAQHSARAESQTTAYAARATPIYADASGRHAVGSLTPGTPVSVAGGASSRVRAFALRGWSEDGAETAVNVEMGVRRIYATLASTQNVHRKVLQQTKDDYDNVWYEVALSGFVASADLTPDQSTVWARAQHLYSQRCSNCHALHAPTEFTANGWPTILKTMAKNAALTPSQAELVTQYLQAHSKPL